MCPPYGFNVLELEPDNRMHSGTGCLFRMSRGMDAEVLETDASSFQRPPDARALAGEGGEHQQPRLLTVGRQLRSERNFHQVFQR